MIFVITTDLFMTASIGTTSSVVNATQTRKKGLSTGELALLTAAKSTPSVTNASKTGKQGLSTGELALLTSVSAFSPGICLLRVAYRAQEKGANFTSIVLLIFWLIAAIDCSLDKIPVLASLHQFFAYLIIWGIAFLGSTYLGGDPSTWIAALAGSLVQGVRQVYTIPTDATIVGAPARSLIEDIVAFLMLPLS